MEINVKDAKSKLSSLLDKVEKEGKLLLSLKEFRGSIRVTGKPLSDSVIRGRDEERY